MGKGKKRGKSGGLLKGFGRRVSDFFGKIELNVWRIITATIVVVTLFIIFRTLYSIAIMGIEISRLNSQKELHLKSIEADSLLLERLKYDEYLEQYAREMFHMQRKQEQVFIFEEE